MKGLEPKAFSDWIGLANEEWTPTYDNLAGAPRLALVSALLQQQGFVCVYCGKQIAEVGADGHIEHFYPQSLFKEWDLAWWNLFVSCGPPKTKNLPKICGAAKGNWVPSGQFIYPGVADCEGRFRFDGLGQILPSQLADQAATAMILRLNLSEAGLQNQRAAIVRAIEEDIANGLIDSSKIAAEIELWRTRDEDGRLKAFGHVAARYLEEEFT